MVARQLIRERPNYIQPLQKPRYFSKQPPQQFEKQSNLKMEEEASQLTYHEDEFEGGEFDSSYEEMDGQLVLREDWEQVEDEEGR